MDINFQDRIDEYLLHPDRLSEEEKSQFLSELEADPKKRAQFELTRDVRLAVTSPDFITFLRHHIAHVENQ